MRRGRIPAVVPPSTIDKVTPVLLIESRAEASTRDLPWTTHPNQSVLEFNIMVDRHGISLIQFMVENDLLGEGVTLGQ